MDDRAGDGRVERPRSAMSWNSEPGINASMSPSERSGFREHAGMLPTGSHAAPSTGSMRARWDPRYLERLSHPPDGLADDAVFAADTVHHCARPGVGRGAMSWIAT
jgi:hypothetical protein